MSRLQPSRTVQTLTIVTLAILFGDESKHILVKKHAVFIDNLDPHVLICYSESNV